MNEVAQTNGGAMTNGQTNFFSAYGEAASQKSLVGTILKFSKGDYTSGSHGDEMPAGTQMVALMDQLLVGWVHWENNKPTDHKMGAIMEGFQPVKRSTLGDTDEDLWERDDNGKPQDPWQMTNYLVLKQVGVEGDAGLFTFTASSRGGLNAIGELCKAFGRVWKTRPNEWPVITLGVDSYVHTKFGKIKVPEFEIVGWAPKEGDGGVVAEPTFDSTGRSPRGSGGHATPADATRF